MRDYTYYLPGYTGFCPDLANHLGESYGKATHHVILQRPRDLLRERLSDVRYGGRQRGQYYNAYHGNHDHNRNMYSCGGKRGCCNACCQPCQGSSNRRYHKKIEHKNYERSKPVDCGYVRPTYVYIEGYAEPSRRHYNTYDGRESMHVHHPTYHSEMCPPQAEQYSSRCCGQGCCPKPTNQYRCSALPHRQYGVVPKYTGHVTEPSRGHYNTYARRESMHVPHPTYHSEMCPPQAEQYSRGCCCQGCCPKPTNQNRCSALPHRQCGDVPKYTGHMTGMHFVRGESYGPSSDRMLRRHQDKMNAYVRCC